MCVRRTLVLAGRTDLRMTTRKLGCPTEYPRVPPGAREVRQPRRHDRFVLPPPWRRVIASATDRSPAISLRQRLSAPSHCRRCSATATWVHAFQVREGRSKRPAAPRRARASRRRGCSRSTGCGRRSSWEAARCPRGRTTIRRWLPPTARSSARTRRDKARGPTFVLVRERRHMVNPPVSVDVPQRQPPLFQTVEQADAGFPRRSGP